MSKGARNRRIKRYARKHHPNHARSAAKRLRRIFKWNGKYGKASKSKQPFLNEGY